MISPLSAINKLKPRSRWQQSRKNTLTGRLYDLNAFVSS